MAAMSDYDQLHANLTPYGQEHLLRFWQELTPPQRQRLADEIEAVDWKTLARLTQEEDAAPDAADLAARAEPPPAVRLALGETPFPREQARASGEAALRAGKVGMIMVAGGQGTRLGFDAPKGMFSLGPVSGRTLFQILIDRLTAVSQRYGTSIPLYLMTSPATHEATVEFMDANDRCGLPAEDLHIFRQGVMPAVCTETGKVLMSDRDSLCLAPDGHGGMLAALDKSGGLQDAARRGIEQLFYCQVDNPLAPCCDPELIGWSLASDADALTLATAKTDPAERVGNIVAIDGKVQILEYSELPADQASRRNPDGSLRLWAGNTAIHVFTLEFLRRVADTPELLPFHRARKTSPCLDDAGRPVTPAAPNSVKFERFIFDLLPAAERAIVVEGAKEEIFAPVKDAAGRGADTPEAAQAAMCALYRRWLRKCGAQVADDAIVEIHPHFALDAEKLAARLPRGAEIVSPAYLQ
jgi:UDP-N-acetylglucosamine/UDP-N-acetylgalactosamine diphosphorylase